MRSWSSAVVAGLLLAGCDHTYPLASPEQPRGPLTTGSPRQVTFNPGSDLRPSWLGDGSGFLYSRERLDRADGDRCLGLMPAAGGSLVREICDRTPAAADSLTAFESAALAADGRLAYVRASSPLVPASIAPVTLELRLGTLADPGGAIVRTLPYATASGRIHQGIDWLQWLSPSAVVYLAQRVEYPRACSSCPPDTVRTGIEVVTLDPTTATPLPVPGTDSATSVAGASGLVYYTLPGDSVVWNRAPPSGAVTAAHVFLPGIAPRDITVAAGRLVAVTGIGHLVMVNLATGLETPLAAGAARVLFKHPALAPDGRRLVVEGYPFQIFGPDTVASRLGDLWVFDLP